MHGTTVEKKIHQVLFKETGDSDCKFKALNEWSNYIRHKPEGYFTYAEVRESDFRTKRKLIDVGDKY